MIETPLVSVVIPIYKVESYLQQCVDSVVNQSYKNLEIILVDDGSPDRCPEICDEYAKQDSRIKVIHKPNGGLSDARNAGIEVAEGEYLSFVDSDDVIYHEMIEVLMQPLIENKELKLSVCQSLSFYNDEDVDSNQVTRVIEILAYSNLLKRNRKIWTTAWGKIYQKNFFIDLKYPVGRVHEDEFVTYKICYEAKKIAYTDSKMYYYRQRDCSIMNTMTIKRLTDIHEAMKEQVDFFLEKKETLLYSFFLTIFVSSYADYKIDAAGIKDAERVFSLWKIELKKYTINYLSVKQKINYKLSLYFPNIRRILVKLYLLCKK